MSVLDRQAKIYMVGGIVAAVALYLVIRNSQSAAQAASKAVVGAAVGAAVGVVEGVGLAVGVPLTDKNLCSIAKQNGNTLDAAMYCTASEFSTYLFTGK